jgi:hypothetical protein
MFSNRNFLRAILTITLSALVGLMSGIFTGAHASDHSTASVKSGASISVNAASTTRAAVNGIGTSAASMDISGVVTAGAGGTSSKTAAGVVAQTTSNFTAVGYDVSTGAGTGSFAGILTAGASANGVTSLQGERCASVATPLVGTASLLDSINLSGVNGQGGFVALDSSAIVNGGVTRTASTIDGVPVTLLTGTITKNVATSSVASSLLTVDAAVLAPAAVQSGSAAADASLLLGKVVTTTP